MDINANFTKAGLAIVFLLQFIWHMPGTIALRNVLIGLFFLITLYLAYQSKDALLSRIKAPILPGIALVTLTCWIVLVNIVWADRPALSWAEFRSQWLLPLVCGLLAWIFAEVTILKKKVTIATLVTIVFWAYFLQVFLHDVMNLWFYIDRGEIAFRNAPVLDIPAMLQNMGSLSSLSEGFSGNNPGFFSYCNAILAALVVAEVSQRLLNRTRLLPFSNGFLLLTVALIVVCSFTLKMRNGNVGLVLLVLFASFMLLLNLWEKYKPTKILGVFFAVLIALSAVSFAFFKSDPRWLGLMETVPFAWETKDNGDWLKGPPYPLLPNGHIPEVSAYERTSMLKEGLSQITERPLGSGYDRNAYGGRMTDRYNLSSYHRGAHAHSGIIDFAIGTGIPGVLLWCVLLGSLAYYGFKAVKHGSVATGLMLIFLVTGYFGRTVVDSVIRDHFLQVFMFLSGWFFAVCYPPKGSNDVNEL